MAIEVVLENAILRVGFLPAFGGKIASLMERSTGVEYLLPPAAPYGGFDTKLSFADSDLGGFDECLPSISACPPSGSTPSIPDHGELWHVPWRVLETSPRVSLTAEGASSGLSLTRTASLDGSALHLRYELKNCATVSRHWIWSSHPLLVMEANDRILMPEQVRELLVGYATSGGLSSGDIVDWPRSWRSGKEVDLSVLQAPDGKTAYKLFASPRTDGWCALHRTRINRVLALRFDPREVPHIGLWICYGAWPQDRDPKQYTLGLEPCTATCDSLLEAIAAGTARTLSSGESTTWNLIIEVLGGDGKKVI